jgi:hypothetical protein
MEPSLDTTKMLDYRYIFELRIKKTDQSMVAMSGEWPADCEFATDRLWSVAGNE